MSQSVLHPRGLCGNELKLLAILAMTVDHIAWSLFPGYSMHPLALLMHAIGRLTCPIMCYFIAEGYHYTRSFQKYALRLLLLAIVSHFAYQFILFRRPRRLARLSPLFLWKRPQPDERHLGTAGRAPDAARQ